MAMAVELWIGKSPLHVYGPDLEKLMCESRRVHRICDRAHYIATCGERYVYLDENNSAEDLRQLGRASGEAFASTSELRDGDRIGYLEVLTESLKSQIEQFEPHVKYLQEQNKLLLAEKDVNEVMRRELKDYLDEERAVKMAQIESLNQELEKVRAEASSANSASSSVMVEQNLRELMWERQIEKQAEELKRTRLENGALDRKVKGLELEVASHKATIAALKLDIAALKDSNSAFNSNSKCHSAFNSNSNSNSAFYSNSNSTSAFNSNSNPRGFEFQIAAVKQSNASKLEAGKAKDSALEKSNSMLREQVSKLELEVTALKRTARETEHKMEAFGSEFFSRAKYKMFD